jgi:cell division protein FtsW
MGLYISILFRAYQNTRRCTQAFPAFLMMGIALLIVFQAIINMMVATGVMPVTGQPLPLISRGGTSVIINGVYFGILLNISRYTTADSLNKKEEEKVPESISAVNPNLKDNL